MGNASITELQASITVGTQNLQESKALLAQLRRSEQESRRKKAEARKLQADSKKRKEEERKKGRLRDKITKLIEKRQPVEGLRNNLKRFVHAQYEPNAVKLPIHVFLAALRYIPYSSWERLQQHPDIFSEVKDALASEFTDMEELLSTFLVAHLFRDFPEFYKGIMRGNYQQWFPINDRSLICIPTDLAELPVKGQHNLKFNYESSQGWPEASTDNDIRSAQLPDSTATTLPVSFPNPSAYPLTILPAPGDPIDSSIGSRAVAQALCAGQEPSPDGWTTDTAEEQFPDQRSQGLGRWKRRRTLEPAVQYTSPSLPSLSTYATTQPHTSPHDVLTNASPRATGYVANTSQPTSDGYNVSGYPTISPQSIASTRLG